MNKWKEKPLSRVLAGLLALLLAIGTLPASPFRANAVDTGLSATFKLVYDKSGTVTDVTVSGSYILRNENGDVVNNEGFNDGRFIISEFSLDTKYTLSVSLSATYVYDGIEEVFFTAPAAMEFNSSNPLTDGGDYSLYCGTVAPIQRTGKVTTPAANEGDPAVPLNEAKVIVSKDGDIEPVTCLSTDENGNYTIALPETLIGQEVSVTAEKSGYVTKTENLVVPADTDFSTISLEPISVTFSVGAGGSVTYGEQTITSESGDLTIYPNPGTVSFTVSPENGYQIASVTKASDTLSPGAEDYSFDIENEKVAVSVSFIRKDTHGPVIAFIKGEGDTYYGLPDANNESWGNGNATQCMISISDPVGTYELTQETEYVSGPAKLFKCLGTVDDVESAIANAESSGEVIILTKNQTAESVAVSAGQGYTFVVTDNDNNPSNLIKATFKQDTIAPTVSSASISCTEGHSFDSAVTNAYVSDSAMTLSIQAQDSPAGVAGAKLYGKEPGTADYTYEDEMNPVENAPGAFTIELEFDTLTELAIELWDKAGNHTGKLPISSLDGIDRDLVWVKTNSSATVSATANNTSVTTADIPNFKEDPSYVFTVSDENPGIHVSIEINDKGVVSARLDPYAPNTEIPLTTDEMLAFVEGENTIKVFCKNAAGIESNFIYHFILDTTVPFISGFTITEKGNTTLNPTAGTTYVNGPIDVTVTAVDPLPDNVTKNSGLSTITLYINGPNGTTEVDSITVNENGQAVFALDPSALTELIGTPISLSATANDNAGNTIVTAAVLGTWNSNISTDTFTFDIKAPEITISDPFKLTSEETATAHYTGEGENQKAWYSEFVRWNVSLSDDVSGIESIEVKLNGTKLDTALDGTTITASLSSFSVSSEAVATDCSSVLTVSVTDKAGNTDEVTKTVYIDMFAPEIKGFLVKGKDGPMHSDAEGNYTNGPVIISVTAEDPGLSSQNAGAAAMPVSGVESISLYIDGSEKPFASSAPDANGKCEFSIFSDIPEDFFETHTVTVEATDCSGLKSARVPLASGSNQGFSSGKIVIENRKPSVSITFSDTGKKTIDGKTWYGADTEVKIQATDAESGLATIAVTVNGTAITADDSATPQAIGTFDAKEKSSPVYVIKTANHIASDDKYTIRVTAKDVSGNVYETEETFYIDRTAPVISGFTVTTEKAGDTLSNLAFGTFANGRVRVTITVKDDGSSAGLDAVALTINDGTPVVSKLSNGVAEFILPEEVVEGFYGAYALKATAVDVYGHTSEVKTYERQIQIDTVKPTVSVSAAGPNPMAKDGKTWYSSDVTWTIRLRDANAGIASATVKVNGTVIATDANGKSISEILAPTDAGSVKDVTFAVISSQAASADGSYTITVETTDYIGNKSEVYSGTVYVDKTAPAITSFAFLRDGEAVSPLTASDFGYVYFFEKDATVVISANDAANGYGLKSITYYMEDFNGVKTAEQTATPDASGNVTITVKAPFRGKIYAKATDGVNNESGYAVSKGFAAETKANHDGTASVSIERNETELRQPNGVDLYSGNVEIKINIADEIAGIKTVEWSVSAPYDQAKNQTGSASVGIDGTITGDGWTATAKDGNLVTGLTRTITVTHDSNDITVRVRMTDWAGNTTERQTVFGIDKVAPTVEYSFDNNTADPANPTIFDDERTLTITVTERNFVPGEFGLTIHNAYGSVPTISQWTEERDTQDPNKSTYTATVTFVYDGSYTLNLGYADRAGNRAAIEQVPAFVIDRSKPLVLVTYDNKKPVQDIYFDNFRTATVTVTERNFDVSRVTFTGNAPRTGTWTANGEEHTLTIYYDEDGDYSFGISVVDKAGNVSVPYDEERFIIDTTVPELELTGLLAANRGEVAPVITYTDANYMEDGVSFLLQRQNGDIINKPYTIEEIVEDGEAKGYRIVFKNFDPMKENDDIYTIQISAVDQAGNRTQQIMRRFSVNRFGSTYIMDGVEKMNGSNTNNPTDLVVLEVNVDEINADDVEIFVIRNSSPTKLVFGRDYDWEKVKMTEDGWEEYRYVIKSSSFAEDGEYTIRIISVDKAGNVNENDENGKNATISFCVDRVAPNIVVVSPVDETSYKEDTHRAVIEVRDNYLLGDVKIYLNDAEVSYSKSNYQYSFEIPQSDTKQTIRIVATDAAGNVSEVIVKDFLVSTNVFVRFLNTTWAIVAFIAILLCIGGAAVFILARRRRR